MPSRLHSVSNQETVVHKCVQSRAIICELSSAVMMVTTRFAWFINFLEIAHEPQSDCVSLRLGFFFQEQVRSHDMYKQVSTECILIRRRVLEHPGFSKGVQVVHVLKP